MKKILKIHLLNLALLSFLLQGCALSATASFKMIEWYPVSRSQDLNTQDFPKCIQDEIIKLSILAASLSDRVGEEDSSRKTIVSEEEMLRLRISEQMSCESIAKKFIASECTNMLSDDEIVELKQFSIGNPSRRAIFDKLKTRLYRMKSFYLLVKHDSNPLGIAQTDQNEIIKKVSLYEQSFQSLSYMNIVHDYVSLLDKANEINHFYYHFIKRICDEKLLSRISRILESKSQLQIDLSRKDLSLKTATDDLSSKKNELRTAEKKANKEKLYRNLFAGAFFASVILHKQIGKVWEAAKEKIQKNIERAFTKLQELRS